MDAIVNLLLELVSTSYPHLCLCFLLTLSFSSTSFLLSLFVSSFVWLATHPLIVD